MHKVMVAGLFSFAVCGWLACPANSEDHKAKVSSAIEHDFRTKVLSVRASTPKDAEHGGFNAGYLEKVQVRRLGDRSFLVGEVAVPVGFDNPYEGVRIWIPLSAVLELGEYENLEAVIKVRKKFENLRPPKPASEKNIH